jgi:DNA-cytosine methyltransferase
MKTFATLFSGIGGSDLGITNVGFQPTYAVEWNRGAIDIFKTNHHIPTVIHADVNSVDYTVLPSVDLLWASPVCCNYSGANHNRGETAEDMHSAYSVIRAAKQANSLIIENVPAYFNSDSYRAISELMQLDGMVFQQTYRLNATRFSNPASRDRTYAVFSRDFFKLDLPPESHINWTEELLKYRDYWLKSELTTAQYSAWNKHTETSKNSLLGVFAIERCGYYKIPKVYSSLDIYPCIKSHTHHDGKNIKSGYGKIGSYRSYMDFIHEGQSYSVTPQLLGVLNGFPINYIWGDNRAQAAAGIGNAVIPRLAEIIANCLN